MTGSTTSDQIKIGRLVQTVAPDILARCEADHTGELARLQDAGYAKETFGLNYPFCREARLIGPSDHVRYYKRVHRAHGLELRVTSQWFAPSMPKLIRYLELCGIPVEPPPREPESPSKDQRAARSRFRRPALGNAQNALVRTILSQIGPETFGSADWDRIVARFGHRCAYCGATGPLEMDHIVPTNTRSLGEHRLGNLVPACATCNARKGQSDHRMFLEDDPETLARIESHMAEYGYTPLTGNADMKDLLTMAREDMRHLADRYARIIATLLDKGPAPPDP